MAAGNWIIYDSFKEYMADNTIDVDGDSFRCQLHTLSYTPALTHSVRADLTNEITDSGYTAGGASAFTSTWTKSGSTTTFTATGNIAQWTAGAGGITARWAVIYDDTPAAPLDPLLGYSLLDTTPADVTATEGNTFTITPNASGIFTLSGATT